MEYDLPQPMVGLAEDVLRRGGYGLTETNVQQMVVYLEAFELFVQRNSTYEDLWKDYGWMDTLTHLRSKSMRLVRKFWRESPSTDKILLDDAMDLINYAVFFVRNFRAGNKWGR